MKKDFKQHVAVFRKAFEALDLFQRVAEYLTYRIDPGDPRLRKSLDGEEDSLSEILPGYEAEFHKKRKAALKLFIHLKRIPGPRPKINEVISLLSDEEEFSGRKKLNRYRVVVEQLDAIASSTIRSENIDARRELKSKSSLPTLTPASAPDPAPAPIPIPAPALTPIPTPTDFDNLKTEANSLIKVAPKGTIRRMLDDYINGTFPTTRKEFYRKYKKYTSEYRWAINEYKNYEDNLKPRMLTWFNSVTQKLAR